MSYTDEQLIKLISKDKFPPGINYSEKTRIRDLYLEGKDKQALTLLRKLIGESNRGEKTLL